MPLVWSDELAEILFLWLAMLGAVIALRRGEHMRLTALVSHLPQRWQKFLAALVAMAAAALVALLLPPAVSYMLSADMITSPTLGIPDSWRVAGLRNDPASPLSHELSWSRYPR